MDTDFLTLARTRCSIRRYKDKKIESDKLERILEAGRVAPTAANRQPQRVLVIRSEEGLAALKNAGNIHGAPLGLVVCADTSDCWVRSYDGKSTADIDVSIVTTHMMLEAADLGLNSIWVCHFDPDAVRKEFNLPDHIEPINILGIGYVDGPVKPFDRHRDDRKPLSETVVHETF